MGRQFADSQAFLCSHITKLEEQLADIEEPKHIDGTDVGARRANSTAIRDYKDECKPIEKTLKQLRDKLEYQERVFGKGAAVGN